MTVCVRVFKTVHETQNTPKRIVESKKMIAEKIENGSFTDRYTFVKVGPESETRFELHQVEHTSKAPQSLPIATAMVHGHESGYGLITSSAGIVNALGYHDISLPLSTICKMKQAWNTASWVEDQFFNRYMESLANIVSAESFE